MIKDLQRVFRESFAAFRAELARREPEDQVAELLAAMRRELVAARAALPALAEAVEATRAEVARERERQRQCERRGAMAERIGDAETARLAEEFAARHRERAQVLEGKARAAEAEHQLRRREAAEMQRQYQEADAGRFALVAQLRQQRTRERMRSALDGREGVFADWERMEERVEGEAALADALEEVVGDVEPPPAAPPSEAELEERLRELKRRMGRQ